ncbi:tetratricopeptide repeat protein [Novosphingobium aerophilum]|uniref:tetratricopeptide repeat protein n=1 Tax=Novosphingobium aerophilum TaxID=2839843 RepID=UPI001BE47AEE|nr:tetratricopeptide repeat protein [Novosphingobium aerophilum]
MPLPLLALPLIASALLPLAAQVGPFTAPGAIGTPLPEPVARPPRARPPAGAAKAAGPRTAKADDGARLRECLAAADDDPEAGADQAQTWLATAKGHEAAEAGLCLGTARSHDEDWSGAEQAFLAALDSAGSDRLLRARLGAMAGNAALAAGSPERALTALDTARTEAKGLADPAMIAPIALDRARALVALGRLVEAGAALGEARTAAPGDSEPWLLSATLARRQGRLAEAQALIERAADLRPVDPDIGLEAGVIAMLAGRPEAARKSWESVVAIGADSQTAATARGYLAQLGPAPAPATRPGAATAGPKP